MPSGESYSTKLTRTASSTLHRVKCEFLPEPSGQPHRAAEEKTFQFETIKLRDSRRRTMAAMLEPRIAVVRCVEPQRSTFSTFAAILKPSDMSLRDGAVVALRAYFLGRNGGMLFHWVIGTLDQTDFDSGARTSFGVDLPRDILDLVECISVEATPAEWVERQ